MDPQPHVEAKRSKVVSHTTAEGTAARPRFRGRRVTFMYPIQVQVLGKGGATLRAHATNLSLGGMFIYSLDVPPVGTKVRIALDVKDRPLLLAEAEVRWVRGSAFKTYPWCPGFGVRFLQLSPKATALVHHLVSKASQRRGEAETVEDMDGRPARAPEPSLPKVLALDAPLDETNHHTQQMYPLRPAAERRPISPALEPRPTSALERQAKGAGGAWRWLRWGLAIAAVAGWLAAFSQARPGVAARVAARVTHPAPAGEPQR